MTDTPEQAATRPSQTGQGNAPGGAAQSEAPSENEMPDPQQVEERVQSGEPRHSAEEAFGEGEQDKQ